MTKASWNHLHDKRDYDDIAKKDDEQDSCSGLEEWEWEREKGGEAKVGIVGILRGCAIYFLNAITLASE